MRTGSRLGWAWIALCSCLAIHVADEAFTGFLAVYNPIAEAVQRRVPFIPLPTFTFRAWLVRLIVAVAILFVLSFFAFRGVWWMRPLSYVLGALMLVNGMAHIAGSIYLRRAAPGVYSAPLLLAASVWLLASAHREVGKESAT